MAYNEASKKAALKYMKEHTDDIRLRVPKGTKEKWKNYAEKKGVSMTRLVLETINAVVDGESEQ